MEVESITYKAKDGRLFDDPLKCQEYEKTLGILSGSVGALVSRLEEFAMGCYMFGIIMIKEADGQTSINIRYTVNLDSNLEDYVNIENLKEEQRYEIAKVDDYVRHLKTMDKDLPCQYMIIYSKHLDLAKPGIMANYTEKVWK